MNPSKTSLRQSLITQRLQLAPSLCASLATHLANHLTKLPILRKAKHLAYYWPVGNEMDPRPIIAQLTNPSLYLPILQPNTRELKFCRYQPGDALKPNRFMIPEPCDQRELLCAKELDLVLMPLLAFDSTGNRLGMGGGYYDSTFHFLSQNRVQRPLLLGLGYEFQRVNELVAEPWDIQLHMAATETNLYEFDNSLKHR